MFQTHKNCNSAAFTPEQIKKGLLQELLSYLLSYNEKNMSGYYDIHIGSDGYCTIVEWSDIMYEVNDGIEGFVWMDEEHCLLKRVEFPDNTYEYYPDEFADEALDEWLKEHPGWYKNEWGSWINKDEEEAARKLFEHHTSIDEDDDDCCTDKEEDPVCQK